MTLGKFTHGFLATPAKLSTREFAGVAFILVIITIAWARFVNELA